MEHFAELGGPVAGFSVGEHCIDCICGRELLKIDKRSGETIRRKTIFGKDGASRKLAADGGQIYIYDFCTLYVFGQADYELRGKWQLGSDLSSDLCGLAVDDDTLYCSIRNGKIITLDKCSHRMREFAVSGHSMWSMKVHGPHLICGTVGGELLLLDRSTLSVEKTLALGKKNIASLCLDGGTLYAASHGGTLFKLDTERFEIEALAKSAHRKMFSCAGIWGDMLVTVSYPCSEIALWRKDTLEKGEVIHTPLRLSGCAHIEGDLLYVSSRNIPGIGRMQLS